MASYKANLTRVEEIAEGTQAFYFSRPAGFDFRAGQFVDITLLDPSETDAEGDIRTFTLASSPFEGHLMVATRMRDTAFKRVLGKAPAGLEVGVEGPSGSFTLHKKAAKPAVFLAGGIGITPFLSIARQAAKENLPHLIHLFFSNRRPEDAPFLDELSGLASRNPNFHLIATMAEMAKSKRPWKGEQGFIDGPMLSRHLQELGGPIYYIAGPPAMVVAMRQVLTAAGVDEDDIRTEEFSGY